MKKFLLSLSVIVLFVFYSIFERNSNNQPLTASGSNANNSGATANQKSQNISYKNGQYTGPSVDAFYGNVQVKAVISGGKIADVIFLDHPQNRSNSIAINDRAMPYLKSEAIQAQSAQVDIISGATFTSRAFIQSLSGALALAHN